MLQFLSSDVARLISEAADNEAARYHCPIRVAKQRNSLEHPEHNMSQWPLMADGGMLIFYCHLALHSLKV